MGVAFLHGNGGSGGGGLNFQVIGGTTAPNNPKENTIWVNTDVEITSWIFSTAQPTGHEGRVWISTGTTSPAAFNALKKNHVMVYPISANQYVDGAWVKKEALSYQGGEWVGWIPDIILFNNGTKDSGLSFTNSYGTTTFSGNYIVCKLTTADETYRAVTKNTYDLTDYNTIRLKWTGLPDNTSFGIEVQKNGKNVGDAVSYSGNGTLNLNVSALKGKHNLCLRMYSGTANKTAKVTYFAILV